MSTFWHSLVGVHRTGRPLTPLYLWSDTRSDASAVRLARSLDAEAVRQRTGCPIHSSYWPAKLAWVRETRPELWRPGAVSRWMSFGDLFFWHLFLRPGTSLSMASGTGLHRLAGGWDEELMAELEIGPEQLPPIAESDSDLRLQNRRRWPALGDVPWFHALGDGALANLGTGCVEPSRRSVTIGTSAAVRVMHPDGERGPIPPGLWRYRLDRSRVVTGGALSAGGNVRAWLERTLAVRGLERSLATSAPGDHGLAVLPHLAGERSPGYASHAFGAISGITLDTTAGDIARAGVEAVALEIARVNERLDAAAPGARTLVASGGAALGSPAWMQLVADATGTPVDDVGVREASSRGAALFALERLGLDQSGIGELRASRTFFPRPAAQVALAAERLRQEELYAGLIARRPPPGGPEMR
jgi:gluconokinase